MPSSRLLADSFLDRGHFVDIADAMEIVGDGRKPCDGASARWGLRLEAGADGELRIQAKGAKDLPIVCVQ
jgi:hypothetical protein